MPRQLNHTYETRVAACADYLLGVKLKVIERRHRMPMSLVIYYVRKRGCFKLREIPPDKP